MDNVVADSTECLPGILSLRPYTSLPSSKHAGPHVNPDVENKWAAYVGPGLFGHGTHNGPNDHSHFDRIYQLIHGLTCRVYCWALH